MKKYIIPRAEVLAVDALLPLMITSDYETYAKKRHKNVFNDDDDANNGW